MVPTERNAYLKIAALMFFVLAPACIMPLVTMDKYIALRNSYEESVDTRIEMANKCNEIADNLVECVELLETCVDNCTCNPPTKEERVRSAFRQSSY